MDTDRSSHERPDPRRDGTHAGGLPDGTDAIDPELLERIYDELRSIATAYMRQERAEHTLQPTALVNEAYLKLAGSADLAAGGRSRFMGFAARAMRQVLVDNARSKGSAKRGGDWRRVTMSGMAGADGPFDTIDTLALDEALTRLAAIDARAASVVELRFFGGLIIADAAETLGVSTATVESDWAFARAWLKREIEDA